MARRRQSQSGHLVLIVDDEEALLESLRPLLERRGHRVLTATSGEEALALLRLHDIQVAVVDYYMPGMDGAELVRAIRTFNPFVQIIVQTGYAGKTPPERVLAELDVQGYHDKGDGPEKLFNWIAVGLRVYSFIQKLQARERAYTELVANVSHELRTPLNIISGYVQLALEDQFGEVPPDMLQPLHSIRSATRSLIDMVSDYLQHTRVEAGVSSLATAPVEMQALASEFERLGRCLLEGEDIRFEVTVEKPLDEFVSDPIKLRTILRNLLTNAIKFTTNGEIAMHFVGRDGQLEVSVRDTGPGIEPGQAEWIFEAFRQGEGEAYRASGGIGLGLALSRKYARLLGGDLRVESGPGVGAIFTLRIPPMRPVNPNGHVPGLVTTRATAEPPPNTAG